MQLEDDGFITKCKCFNPPSNYKDFEDHYLGTTKNYAEISVKACRNCGTKWLNYFYENEAFTKTGRWYRGVISDKDLAQLLPEQAAAYLENLEWYIYGGSYFETNGKYGIGEISKA